MISARRDWRWWLPWRMWLLAAGLTCSGVVAAKSGYWWGYAKTGEDYLPISGMVAGGARVDLSGELRLEVEVVDEAGGETRTEEVVISTAPEPGVAVLLGIGVMMAALRRGRGVRAG